jgi:2,3-dihydroxybenzoate-AMP ligase/mycobactin salicyl-AMP ligase
MFEFLEGAPPYREDDAEDYLRRGWWSGLTFGDLIDRAADIHPNKEAFVDRQTPHLRRRAGRRWPSG